MDSQQKLIEDEILRSTKRIIEGWNNNLESKGIEIEISSISRSGDNETYFSEIEFIFWKDDNVETFFSLIIFMEGRQHILLNEIHAYIDDEIKASLESLS